MLYSQFIYHRTNLLLEQNWERVKVPWWGHRTGCTICGAVAAPSGKPAFPGAGLCSGEAAGPAASSWGAVVKSKCTGDLTLDLPSRGNSLGIGVYRGAAEQVEVFPRKYPSKEQWAHTWGGTLCKQEAGTSLQNMLVSVEAIGMSKLLLFCSLFLVYFPNREYAHNPRLPLLNYFSSLLYKNPILAAGLDTRKSPGCCSWLARRQRATTPEIFFNTKKYKKNTQSSYSSQWTEPISEAQWLKF